MTPVSVTHGNSPVILGQPHGGTFMPVIDLERLNDLGQALADTDWHIGRLYDGLLDNATVVRANFHRYLIDANRDPAGHSLYPGLNTTGLCPVTDFDGKSIYREAREPNDADVQNRLRDWHQPYHAALATEIARVKAEFGCAIVFDCHSIRSVIPFLFDGRLPDFSIGTNSGGSCDVKIETVVADVCKSAAGYSSVVNGRFKGGWTTRYYGSPHTGVHAIQLELAQSSYMEEHPPWAYVQDRADQTRQHLRRILKNVDTLARRGALNS